jgi:Holliday junction resolvase
MTGGRASQRKGSRAERELASVLTDLLGVECRKGSSPFLPGIIAPDVHVAGNIHVECKRRERFSLPAALRQSRHDAGAEQVAVVAHRPNRSAWMVTAELADLPRLAAAVMAIIEKRATKDE